jgi:TRAP-type C4-dicarboxylate transport system permease small subunit
MHGVLLGRMLDAVTRAMFGLACLIVALLVVLVNVEVGARYFLNSSTLVADEYGGYALVWICLLGFAQALRTGQFLRVDALVTRLPRAGRRVTEVVAALVGLATSAVLAQATLGTTLGSWHFGSLSIQPSMTPLWLPQAVMPLGFGWLCLVYLRELVVALRWRAAA